MLSCIASTMSHIACKVDIFRPRIQMGRHMQSSAIIYLNMYDKRIMSTTLHLLNSMKYILRGNTKQVGNPVENNMHSAIYLYVQYHLEVLFDTVCKMGTSIAICLVTNTDISNYSKNIIFLETF